MGLRYPRVSGPRMRTILLLCLPVAALVAFVAIVFVLDLPDLATQRCCFAAGGFLGSLGAGGVLAGHARGTPKMRRHPQPLVAYRSLADLYVSLHFFVFSLVDYRVRNRCNPLTAALLETFVISGELWSVCSVHDMQESIQNPFARSRDMMKRYHAVVWASSAALAVGLSAHASQKTYGPFAVGGGHEHGVFRYCYLNSKITWAPWVFLYGPIVVLYFFALAMTLKNLHAAYSRYATSLARGGSLKLPTTFATHLHVLAINNTNLVAITLFWFSCGSTFALGYWTLGRHDDAAEFRNFRVGFGYVCSYAAAFLLPMKGCVDFMVWLLPHEPRDIADALRLPVAVAAEAPDESEPRPPSTVGEEPELKFALQREIFAYMKVGIVAGATRSDAARLSGDPAKVRAAERFALTAVAADGAPPSLQERLLTFQRFARLALSPTIEDQRELRRRCCADFADDGDARRSSNDRLSLVARVLEDDGDLALAPLAGDARPSEDDARHTFQWTTSKRARKRRPFSRGDVGFRCWAPVEIGAGNG